MRPLGVRLFEVCEVVERIGPCTYRQIWQAHQDMDISNARVYAERGVKHGLLIVDRSIRPAEYVVAEGWRSQFKPRQPIQPKPERRAEMPKFVASVFDLGSL